MTRLTSIIESAITDESHLNTYIFKFRKESDLHNVYTNFKSTGIKLTVDPKHLLLKVQLQFDKADTEKLIHSIDPDIKFEIKVL